MHVTVPAVGIVDWPLKNHSDHESLRNRSSVGCCYGRGTSEQRAFWLDGWPEAPLTTRQCIRRAFVL